jgi:hypothetical protein
VRTKQRRGQKLLIEVLIVISLCTGVYFLYGQGRPAPVPLKRKIFEGVTYHREVRYYPHPRVAHVLVINTKTRGIQFLVTPPVEDWREVEYPLTARTTSQFLLHYKVQIAINGDGFYPWWSNSLLDYYPHDGDPVNTNGRTASGGKVYSSGSERKEGKVPTLYISRRNSLSFNIEPSKIFSAISGDRMLLLQGTPIEGLDDSELDPRTAIGLNRNGRWLILVVVDGRQPFYSAGATFSELADILLGYGAFVGMVLDGGGSSTMVVEGQDGNPVVLNSSIDQYVPGRERPVANHLGIYVHK